MKQASKYSAQLLLFAMLILYAAQALPVLSHYSTMQTPRIFLEPSTVLYTPVNGSLGAHFNVTVRVADVADVAGWQVRMYYEDDIINVTRWFEPTWDTEYVFYGKSTLATPTPPGFVYGHTDPNIGFAMVSSAMFPPPPSQTPFSGDGILCVFEFEVTAAPGQGEIFSCALGINNIDTYVLDSYGSIISPISKEDGYYEFQGEEEPPPPPDTTLYVDPPEIIDPTIKPCQTFSINITIDAVQDLKTCEFNLSYDSSIITFIGINILTVEGQYPVLSMVVDEVPGYVWVKLVYDPTVTFYMPTPLVTIWFHVEAYGSTVLDLHDTELGDSNDDPIDHAAEDGFFQSLIRDVAIIDVVAEGNWTYQDRMFEINVTAKNLGNLTETFDVSAYYDSNLIGTQLVVDLPVGAEITLTFVWNTSQVEACNTYTISAEASPVPFEDTGNNSLADGTVKVYYIGDVNRDGSVDIQDIYIIILAYGSYPGHYRWDPNSDLNLDEVVDLIDIFLAILNYGKSCSS